MTGQDMAGAIQEVERLTAAAKKTSVLDVKDEPTGVYFLVGPDGKAEKKTADPNWHDEKLATPDDLRQFIIDRDETGATFYDEKRIVFVFDPNDRRHRASCDLILSPQYRWLAEKSGTAMGQADFVRLLRVTFRGCLASDGNLLPLVRQLKFESAADRAGVVQHGRESISRNVMAQVSGEAALPEDVVLNIPVFENHIFRTSVACALEVLPHEQQFRLTPFPLELRGAMNDGLDKIRAKLTGDNLPAIYQGQP